MASFNDVMVGLGTVLIGGIAVAAAASNPEAFAEALNEGSRRHQERATDEDIESIVEQVGRQSWDQQRAQLVAGFASHRQMSCAQLKELLRHFDFDGGRIEVVKAVLRGKGVSDPHRAYEVSEAFTFGGAKAARLISELS